MSEARYTVLTYDHAANRWTPQKNLKFPWKDIPVGMLRRVLRRLRNMGYETGRSATDVWVERTDRKVELIRLGPAQKELFGE